jgi:hypothetical protein
MGHIFSVFEREKWVDLDRDRAYKENSHSQITDAVYLLKPHIPHIHEGIYDCRLSIYLTEVPLTL